MKFVGVMKMGYRLYRLNFSACVNCQCLLSFSTPSMVSSSLTKMSFVISRETQGDGEESAEEESSLTGASSDAPAQTGSQEVRRKEYQRKQLFVMSA